MISKETAIRLSQTCESFAQADRRLRETHDGDDVQAMAEDYVTRRAEHQAAVEQAEREADGA